MLQIRRPSSTISLISVILIGTYNKNSLSRSWVFNNFPKVNLLMVESLFGKLYARGNI